MNRPSRPVRVLARLERFANLLDWHDLRFHSHMLEEGTCVIWYLSGKATGDRQQFTLQINEHPIGSTELFATAVHCLKYRLCSGLHTFSCRTLREAQQEAERLRPWLGRAQFETVEAIRLYRRDHPECANYSWTRLRERGEPHYPCT